jgi:hypothetical protein
MANDRMPEHPVDAKRHTERPDACRARSPKIPGHLTGDQIGGYENRQKFSLPGNAAWTSSPGRRLDPCYAAPALVVRLRAVDLAGVGIDQISSFTHKWVTDVDPNRSPLRQTGEMGHDVPGRSPKPLVEESLCQPVRAARRAIREVPSKIKSVDDRFADIDGIRGELAELQTTASSPDRAVKVARSWTSASPTIR